jgi:hypothetical protein
MSTTRQKKIVKPNMQIVLARVARQQYISRLLTVIAETTTVGEAGEIVGSNAKVRVRVVGGINVEIETQNVGKRSAASRHKVFLRRRG